LPVSKITSSYCCPLREGKFKDFISFFSHLCVLKSLRRFSLNLLFGENDFRAKRILKLFALQTKQEETFQDSFLISFTRKDIDVFI
jgi:hypothetical protein